MLIQLDDIVKYLSILKILRILDEALVLISQPNDCYVLQDSTKKKTEYRFVSVIEVKISGQLTANRALVRKIRM